MIKSIIFGFFITLLLYSYLDVVPCLYAGEKTSIETEVKTEQTIIISIDNSIQIDIINATLYDTLKAITKKSKINFEVPESLLYDKLNFHSIAKNWSDTIKRMLKSYNIAYEWDKSGLHKVFIFERGTGKIVQLMPPSTDELSENQSENTPDDASIDISSQSSAAKNQVPQELLEDPAFQVMSPLPDEVDKIIEIKQADDHSESQAKKPGMEKSDDFLMEGFPEFPPGFSGHNNATPGPQ